MTRNKVAVFEEESKQMKSNETGRQKLERWIPGLQAKHVYNARGVRRSAVSLKIAFT